MSEIERLEQINLFHIKRINKIKRGDVPQPFVEGGKIIVHLIPYNALEMDAYYDLSIFDNNLQALKPLKDPGHDITYTHEGLMSFSKKERQYLSYALLFGNGIIEAVDSWFISFANIEGERLLPTFSIEGAIKSRTAEYLALQKELGAELPICLYLNILGVKGLRIGAPAGMYLGNTHPILEDNLIFHRIRLANIDTSAEIILKTWFDRLWQAGGYPRSAHYDESGNWIER